MTTIEQQWQTILQTYDGNMVNARAAWAQISKHPIPTNHNTPQTVSESRGESTPSRQPAKGTSRLEADMGVILENADLPPFVGQYEPFRHLGRKHRIDWAFVPQKIALEVNGGAHGIKRQMTADTEKLFLLQREGWFVIVATKEHVYNGVAVARVRDALEMRGQK